MLKKNFNVAKKNYKNEFVKLIVKFNNLYNKFPPQNSGIDPLDWVRSSQSCDVTDSGTS